VIETVSPTANVLPADGEMFSTVPGSACEGLVVTVTMKPASSTRDCAVWRLSPSTRGTVAVVGEDGGLVVGGDVAALVVGPLAA
jgi:hypothetical protein